MIPAWVWITFGAALAQSLRFMFQKQMVSLGLRPAATTFARFVFAVNVFVAIELATWRPPRISL